MNRKGILILLLIIAYVFLMSSFILSHLFGLLEFIAYGETFDSSINYIFQYPLNIVVGANVLLAVISIALLLCERKRQKK